MRVEMTVTRLRICKYILVQLNLRVVHLVCGFNQTTILYYLFVDREGSDETAHLQIYTSTVKLARGAPRVWFQPNHTMISYYLFVDREGSDETVHLHSLV